MGLHKSINILFYLLPSKNLKNVLHIKNLLYVITLKPLTELIVLENVI